MQLAAGYQHLIDKYELHVMPMAWSARIDSRIKGRDQKDLGTDRLMVFDPSYKPGDSLVAHLQFALRYEGVNLQVLERLYEAAGGAEVAEWLEEKPSSGYARRACFLYEWITGDTLPIEDPVPRKTRYVPALDLALQYGSNHGARNERFKIYNNLPGTPEFCPLVRKTDFLLSIAEKDLHTRTQNTLAKYDEDLLRRAAAFLYLKETQSSFEVEREKPSPTRAQRFADLLREADARAPLTKERLVELQNAVVDPRFREFDWRSRQNWVGKDLGYRQQIDFVPARPEDLPSLMNGLLDTAARSWDMFKIQSVGKDLGFDGKASPVHAEGDPVIAAASIAFGFVFIHPFMDGNGRIHRYLIHEVLAKGGFTPRGIVLPISAVILANIDDYIEVLEQFSRPLRRVTDYSPDTPEIPAKGNDAIFFRFFDATEQAEFLYRALEKTVEEDLQGEIDFLIGFDRACTALNDLLDWPDHSMELFIRMVHQNGGILSNSKRKRTFEWMTEAEVEKAQIKVREAFYGPELP